MFDIEDRWNRLVVPSEAHQGFEVDPSSGVWLSVDSEGRRCVLLRNDTDRSGGSIFFETKGIIAFVDELKLGDQPINSFIVVACRDYRYWEPFLSFAESVREERRESTEGNEALTLRILRTWQWLWKMDPSLLNRDSATGLIGELWFLNRWIDIESSLEAWCGPEGNVHDFVGSNASVEVKTCLSSSFTAPVHQIGSLQQLSPTENGNLYLFSLVITPDETAANTLSNLVANGLAKLENDPYRRELFLEKLSRVGWASPLGKQFDFSFRIISEQLYRVDEAFPALSGKSFVDNIPAAVRAIKYDLDMGPCIEWRVATSAEEGFEYLGGITIAD